MPEPAAEFPTFEPESLVGTTLDGRYVLTAHLATGGMGAVFRAQHVHLRKEFAVKVLRPDLTGSADLVERFRREAEIASALDHDNIVKVSDFGRSEAGYLFLVMELLTGESLFDRLRREGFLSPEEAVPILWQICAALEAAHALGVVHRDLKPENVFLARSASRPRGDEDPRLRHRQDRGPDERERDAGGHRGRHARVPRRRSRRWARRWTRAPTSTRWGSSPGASSPGATRSRPRTRARLLMMQATRPVPPLTEPRPDLAAYPALVAAVAKACAKEPIARHQSAGAPRGWTSPPRSAPRS